MKIRRSFEVHRNKGTRKSVETSLEALGFNVDLSEWFEYGGSPHTFRIDAFGEEIFEAGYQVNAALLDEVTRLIETVKPARTHFDLRVGESFKSGAEVRSGVRTVHLHQLETDVQLRPALLGWWVTQICGNCGCTIMKVPKIWPSALIRRLEFG